MKKTRSIHFLTGRILFMGFLILLLSGCRSSDSVPEGETETSIAAGGSPTAEDDGGSFIEETWIYDGDYCASVTYENPNTGTSSEYTLTIEVADNELQQIHFPLGWLDTSHFGSVEVDEDGYARFTLDNGYEYTVQIIGEAAGCFTNVPPAVQCMGITEEGDQCEHLTDNASGYCWQHEDQGDW